MNKPAASLLLIALFSRQVLAQTLPLSALAELDARFQSISAVETLQAQPVQAEVSYKAGEALNLLAPRSVQQLRYLVSAGDTVKKGQPVAQLGGSELHHFLLEYRSNRELMQDAKRRYDSNRALYRSNAISAAKWREISETYFDSYLEYEHMHHFYQLVVEEDEEQGRITIVAPEDGIIEFSTARKGLAEGERIAAFIPAQAIRLKANIPHRYRSSLLRLRADGCTLEVDSISGIANGFFIEAWSKPLTADCRLLPGQSVQAIPVLKTQAYTVPSSAVFRWQQRDAVFLQMGEELQLVHVELIGNQGSDYVVRSEQALAGQAVLSSSISAVQGILLGLGGE